MFRPVLLAAALVWTSAIAASAQTANPVMQHYRAYQAALDARDLATAEQEAAAALAASEARDGDGGRTGVLALNLASVRFLNNNAAGALEPGRRALAISQSAGEAQSGVSPILAQLIVGRAELAANVTGADERLATALDAAQQARLDPAEIYDAAVELGGWSIANRRFPESRRAWAVAAEYAEGSRFGAQFARASAQTGAAAALLLSDLQDQPRRRLSEDAARDAWQMLNEAVIGLRPIAEMNADGAVTYAQRAYAHALAWRAVLEAKAEADRLRLPDYAEAQGDADGLSEVDVPSAPAVRPRCFIRLRSRDDSRLYPEDALSNGELAGVAARFRLDEEGRIVDIEALSVVGSPSFGEAVTRRAQNWRVQRHPDSPPNCRMAMTVIIPISFMLGG